jgi:hypothetical protein
MCLQNQSAGVGNLGSTGFASGFFPVVQAPCASGDKTEQWQATLFPDGSTGFISLAAPLGCLTGQGNGAVDVEDCLNGQGGFENGNSAWVPEQNPDGTFSLLASLDASYLKSPNMAGVQYSIGSATPFRLSPVPGATPVQAPAAVLP